MKLFRESKVRRILIIVGIAVAVIAAAVAIMFFCLSRKPAVEIAKAAKNTAEAESFTVGVMINNKYTTYKVALDFDKRDIVMVSEDNEEAGSISGIYGGYYFECVYSETAGQWVGVKEDISESAEELFNIWENMCDGDIGGNVIFDIAECIFIAEGETLKEHIDSDGADKAVRSAIKYLLDDEWLENCLGYELSVYGKTNVHSFNVNFAKLSYTADDVLRDCAKSSAAEYVFERCSERLEDLDGRCTLEAEIAVGEKFINSINVSFTQDKECSSYKLTFSDIGSTKIDTEILKEYIEYCG